MNENKRNMKQNKNLTNWNISLLLSHLTWRHRPITSQLIRMAGNLSTVHVRRRLVFSDVTLHDRLQSTGLLETLILPRKPQIRSLSTVCLTVLIHHDGPDQNPGTDTGFSALLVCVSFQWDKKISCYWTFGSVPVWMVFQHRGSSCLFSLPLETFCVFVFLVVSRVESSGSWWTRTSWSGFCERTPLKRLIWRWMRIGWITDDSWRRYTVY